MKLTIAILAQNEEQMIERAIATSRWADEVLVVDGGSTDGTITTAEQAGARVIERPFDDFARQRNFALEAARGEWVLFVDSDERCTPELAKEISKLLQGHPDAEAYAIVRKSMALGRWLDWHLGGLEDAPVRLLRKGSARWSGQVHEVVEGAAHVGKLAGPLLHLTHRSVSEVVQKIDRYTTYQAAELVAKGASAPKGRDVMRAFGRSMRKLWRSGLKREGDVGAVEAFLLAFNDTLVMAKVWERTRTEPIEQAYARADEELQIPAPNVIELPKRDNGA